MLDYRDGAHDTKPARPDQLPLSARFVQRMKVFRPIRTPNAHPPTAVAIGCALDPTLLGGTDVTIAARWAAATGTEKSQLLSPRAVVMWMVRAC
jgi:hypothetical protein